MLEKVFHPVIRSIHNISIAPFKTGPHITRFYMYDTIKEYVTDTKGKVLSISGSVPLCTYLGMDALEIVEANYPEHNLLDLVSFKENEFDYVVCDQVLEHVEGNPQSAVDECYRVLKPGGTLVLTTCFINPIHMELDFWRFTPSALQLLCKNFSEIINSGGWGNSSMSFIERIGLRFVKIPRVKWHPMNILATKNNEKIPVTTWVIAKK